MPNTRFSIPKLKGLMAEKGCTYQDLANIIGKSKATVHSKMTGNRKFSIDELTIISTHFNVSRDYFFKE